MTRFHWVLLAAAVTAGGCGSQQSASPRSATQECLASLRPVRVDLVEDPEAFTPYEAQRSHLPDMTLKLDNSAIEAMPATVGKLQLAGTMTVGDTSSAAYLAESNDRLTYASVLTSGGAFLDSTVVPAGEDPIAGLPDFVIARATFVTLSDQADGYVSWDDPINAAGMRPHRVVWVQNGMLYSLVSDLAATDLLSVAQQVSCSLSN